jgi:ribosome-associated protein
MDEDDPVTPAGRRLDPAAFSWRFSRSSGAGGQHVNTTDSKAELTVVMQVAVASLGETVSARVVDALGPVVRITASEHRSQLRNRQAALDRLGVMIDNAARVQRARRATRPTRGSVDRRIAAKRHQSTRKSDRRWRPDD